MVLFLCSCSFTTDTTRKLNVLWHDSDSLRMNCTQVGILKKAHEIGFACLLKVKSVKNQGLMAL